ncbi:MAG: AMP-binding protein, partial [bacterium]|nr:AMP-binding protein [bacterium]
EFEQEIPELNLPTDFRRPAIQSSEGAGLDFQLSGEDSHALKTAALENGCTLFMVLLAVTNILLSKLSGQEDIVIGTAIAGRRHADLEKIIGMFVNTLAFRNYPGGTKSVKEFIEEVKKRALDAFGNQEYPFEELVGMLDIKRDAGRNPLFDVMLMLNNINTGPGAGDTTSAFGERDSHPQSPVENYENRVAKFDLTIAAADTGENLAIGFQYCERLFKRETILRFMSYFKRIVSSINEESNIKLSAIEVISPEEKQQLLSDFNDTAAEFPGVKTLHRLFAEQVSRTPHRSAVIFRDRNITYDLLNRRAALLSTRLIATGVSPGAMVGIFLNHSPLVIVAILAVLKSGAAYVPLDPHYPVERINYILNDSRARVLLTGRELSRQISFEGELLAFDSGNGFDTGTSDQPESEGDHLSSDHPGVTGDPRDPAYVIYTSGSTGKPKGVVVEHLSIVNYIYWAKAMYVRGERINFPLYTSISFDLTVTSIFTPVLTGNAVVVFEVKDKQL